jgi:16S rRNA (uracil1498-N3)-methyltransferase
MRKYRFYYPNQLVVGKTYLLDEVNNHQILKVLRLKPENEIWLFNNTNFEFKALIQKINKDGITVIVNEKISNNKESNCKIYLAQAIAKGQKMDYIIQKAVELGVTCIIPLISARTIVDIAAKKIPARIEHWKKIIIGACCQCGRNVLPTMHIPITFQEWVIQNQNITQIILDPNSNHSITKVTANNYINLFVGPEGGFSKDELTWAKQRNCLSVSLGSRILRTETASVVAITALQLQFGDLS